VAGRRRSRARRFRFENGLSLFFLGLFLVALALQAVAGHRVFNSEELEHGGSPISFPDYLTTSHFAQAVTENWQSEYLQFVLFVVATVWFVQRGSPESKPLDRVGRESDEDQRVGAHARPDSPRPVRLGGLATSLYSHSLAIFAVYLRERGSPESKPVGASHDATGVEG
jgi:hypothetical protein